MWIFIYQVTIGKEESLEIDFVAKRREERIYIQVAYLLADEKTADREFRALAAVKDNYPKFVVTMDEINRSRDGILHRNIRKFLTGREF